MFLAFLFFFFLEEVVGPYGLGNWDNYQMKSVANFSAKSVTNYM